MTAPSFPTMPAAPSISTPSQISTRMENLTSTLALVPGRVDALRVHVEALPAIVTQEWNSGTNYPFGASAWSPIDLIDYRCIVAAGPSHGSTSDPSLTPSRWVNPNAVPSAEQDKIDLLRITQARNLASLLIRPRFVAAGPISARRAVRINSDGTVSQVSDASSANAWFALSRDAASDEGELRLWWIGDYATGFTGLTYGVKYYADTDGTLTTSDTGREVGFAVSTTEIHITKAGI